MPSRLHGQPFEDPLPEMASGRFLVPPSSRSDKIRMPGQDLNSKWFLDRRSRGAFGKDDEGLKFMLKHLYFEDDEADDLEWGPIRLLGKGGFGQVALWQKRNASNEPVDEVVCKQIHLDMDNKEKAWKHQEANSRDRPRLAIEAVFQRDMNVKRSGIAPHLRRFRFIAEDPGNRKGKYRLYSEFCPHMDLSRLRRLYRCWDRYLPEVFVWYVFHRLAWGCETMREHPPRDSLAVSRGKINNGKYKDIFCLHMDLKPHNILLGSPDDEHNTGHDFPAPLLNDFGVSVYTSHEDRPRNPTQMWWRGTRVYDAPELASYGIDWDIPPDHTYVNRDQDNKLLEWKQAKHARKARNEKAVADVFFDPSMNIYGIGHIMYSLITLTRDSHLQKIRAKTRRRYQRNGNHQISGVYTKKPGVYSSHLRHLVHRCLDPSPSKRPTQLELMDETARGLRMAEKRARRNGQTPEKLYFRGHEINDLPLGDAGFHPWSTDWQYFIRSEFVDPDIPHIRLPREKYGKFPDALSKPPWKKMYREANDHRKWFQPVVTPQPA